jgi:glycosyltransferase involved in cell wall biosynthesis
MPQRVVCLIPARNAAEDLPACLDSAAQICDLALALDDGSTDHTRRVLDAHPLVRLVLANPVRVDYAAWDDAANRNRLLDAAAAFEPDWILSLDADERIAPDDAAALRAFLETDALPGCAYGFQHIAMRGDAEHQLPRFQWIYRLFSYEAGQRFPQRKLHFVPIPTAIPRALWFRTTVRIQHFGSVTADRRLARFEKYAEADPDRRFQADYSHLLHNPAPSELIRWAPRPPGLPVLAAETRAPERPSGGVALSAIVIARNDAATIARTVGSVVSQVCPEPFETIVVVSGSPDTAAAVRASFPQAILIELDRPVLPGAARNAGLAAARGEFVSFPGSHVELPPGSLAARLAAHRRGYALVTGVAVNGNETPAGWASYFLDHHEGLPGHGASVIDGAPAHCSYARQPLVEIGGFPEDRRTGEDTFVNRRLIACGYEAVRDPAIVFTHRSPCQGVSQLARHHFTRGRGWGRLQLEAHSRTGHLLTRDQLRARLIGHLPRRLARIDATVRQADPTLVPRYEAVRGLIRLGAAAAWAGMWLEILKPARGKRAVLLGSPVLTLALVTPAPDPAVVVVEIDRVAALVRRTAIPLTLRLASVHAEAIPLADALGSHDQPLPMLELRDQLELALDHDLDGLILTNTAAIPRHRDDIIATTLLAKTLDRAVSELRRFRHSEWLETYDDDEAVRSALRSWRTGPVAIPREPAVWMP